jgi:DNA-binding GntR family transcriptional regulator
MREALESYAAAKAAERISATELAKLQVLCDAIGRIAEEVRLAGKSELDGEQLKAFLSADMAFHMLILQASGNGRILRSVTETRAVSGIFRMRRQKHDLEIVRQVLVQHTGIMESLAIGDGRLAHQRMAEHIASSKSQTLAQFDQESGTTFSELPSDLPADVVRALERIEKAGPTAASGEV